MSAVRRLIFVAVASVASLSASAQDVGGAIDLTGMGIYGMEDVVMDAARGGTAKKGVKRPVARTNPLTFTPSLARRKANYAAFVAKMRAKDPQEAANMQATFAKTDVVAAVQRITAPMGFRKNSAADAYATWLLVAYGAAHGKDMTTDRATAAAVRAQVARAFGSAKGASALSDAVKQQLADACLVQAVYLDTALEQARQDPTKMAAVQAAARQGARNSGVNVDRLTLTARGFVAK